MKSLITLSLVNSRNTNEMDHHLSNNFSRQPAPSLYAGEEMDVSGWMDTSGQLDAGKVFDRLKDARFNHGQNVAQRLGNRGYAPAQQAQQAQAQAQNRIIETVKTAEAIQQAQKIQDQGNFNWPCNLNVVSPATFAAAAAVANGVGITPPRNFFARQIVILGADLLSIERFDLMGEKLFQGATSGIASQFKSDSTCNIELNVELDTVPIIFAGTCIVGGVIGVSIVGYLKKVGGRRG